MSSHPARPYLYTNVALADLLDRILTAETSMEATEMAKQSRSVRSFDACVVTTSGKSELRDTVGVEPTREEAHDDGQGRDLDRLRPQPDEGRPGVDRAGDLQFTGAVRDGEQRCV